MLRTTTTVVIVVWSLVNGYPFFNRVKHYIIHIIVTATCAEPLRQPRSRTTAHAMVEDEGNANTTERECIIIIIIL